MCGGMCHAVMQMPEYAQQYAEYVARKQSMGKDYVLPNVWRLTVLKKSDGAGRAKGKGQQQEGGTWRHPTLTSRHRPRRPLRV